MKRKPAVNQSMVIAETSGVQPPAVAGFANRWVGEKEAAAFLGVSTPYLQKARVTGAGPKYAKLHTGRTGAVRYLLGDLQVWMESKCRANTSEAS
ncbi:MAG: hypothetical protein IPI39_00510 [Candidatus Obscuribacter sp.]|nr:hypothetical protein [Candidatus Obscuribacter sp.]